MALSFEKETKHLRALVNRARYQDAYRYAKKLYLSHRDQPEAQYLYAVMLGDNNEGLDSRQSEINRRTSVRLLKPIMLKLKRFDLVTRHRIRNEYYWFSRQYRKQYLLGSEGVQRGIHKSSYSQGVGAAWHALQYAQTGRAALATRWANKSVRAWHTYLRSERYYNAYVHLGLAYGVLGQTKEMEQSLRRGAREAGKPDSFHEFSEIRDLVSHLPRLTIEAVK